MCSERYGVGVVSLVVGDGAECVRSSSCRHSCSQRLRHLRNSQDVCSRIPAEPKVLSIYFPHLADLYGTSYWILQQRNSLYVIKTGLYFFPMALAF